MKVLHLQSEYLSKLINNRSEGFEQSTRGDVEAQSLQNVISDFQEEDDLSLTNITPDKHMYLMVPDVWTSRFYGNI